MQPRRVPEEPTMAAKKKTIKQQQAEARKKARSYLVDTDDMLQATHKVGKEAMVKPAAKKVTKKKVVKKQK